MMNIKIIKLKKLYFIKNPERFCRLPYPGHPKGCPNVDKSLNCPPKAQRIEDKYDLSKPCYFIVYSFDIAAQKARMRNLHPKWSDKQCACCLYWQNGVRRELKKFTNDFRQTIGLRDYDYNLIPEAMGLNVFGTARKHGIPMKRNPYDILYKIAFVGVLK
jgi:hypothetical protein